MAWETVLFGLTACLVDVQQAMTPQQGSLVALALACGWWRGGVTDDSTDAVTSGIYRSVASPQSVAASASARTSGVALSVRQIRAHWTGGASWRGRKATSGCAL